MMRQRENWIDCWKGILIFLVVLGHVAGMMRYVVGGEAFQFLNHFYTAIYLFHVPAFFFLAGYVSSFAARRERSERFEGFVLKKVRRLVVPYFVWGVMSVVVFLVLRGMAGLITHHAAYRGLELDGPWWQPFLSLLHAGGWPNGRGFICNGVLWFLPVMFLVSLAYELVARVTKSLSSSLHLHLLSAPLLFVLGGVIQFYGPHGMPWGLDRVPFFLGFMIVGEMVGRLGKRQSLGAQPSEARPGLERSGNRRSPPKAATALCGVVGLLGVYLALAWVWPDLGYRSWYWLWYGFGIFMAIFGSSLALMTARWLPSVPLLAAFGRASLTIMLAHKFLVLPVQVVLAKAGQVGDGVGVAAVALMGSVVLAWGISWICGSVKLRVV